MRIIRAKTPSDFTQVPNALVRDKRLSWKARGLLTYLLSHADGWETDAERLATQGPDGRAAILAAMKELRDAGYMVSRKVRIGGGRWGTEVFVYDTPIGTEGAPPGSDSPTSENRTPVGDKTAGRTGSGLPNVGPPNVGSSDVGKPNLYKKTKEEEQQEEQQEPQPRSEEDQHGGTLPPNPLRPQGSPSSSLGNESESATYTGETEPLALDRNHRPRARGFNHDTVQLPTIKPETLSKGAA